MGKLRYIKNKQVLAFNWDDFSNKLKLLLDFNSRNSVVAISDSRWEECIYTVLKEMGEKYKNSDPKWELGSHKPGADIWIDKFSISAKSGGIKNGGLVISSYRLTRFGNLEGMKCFIDSPKGKNFDIYLCNARIDDKQDGSRTYQTFLVDANIFSAKTLNWKESYSLNGKTHSGWEGKNSQGVVVRIVKNMSNQLWISVPLSLCNLLLEIAVPGDELGIDSGGPLEEQRTQ